MTINRVRNLHIASPQGHSDSLIKESRFVFNYETSNKLAEASLALPIRAESYSSENLFSIFQMNKPEGYLLEFIKDRFSKKLYLDDMMLLKLTGANQIGRLTYSDPEGFTATHLKPQVAMSEIISSGASEELFEFLVDAYFSSGISGFQPKVIVPVTVGAGLKLSICAGLKLTRRFNDIAYYTGRVSQPN